MLIKLRLILDFNQSNIEYNVLMNFALFNCNKSDSQSRSYNETFLIMNNIVFAYMGFLIT